MEEVLRALSVGGLTFRQVVPPLEQPNPPPTPTDPDAQLSSPLALHLITAEMFTEDQLEDPSESAPNHQPGPDDEPEPDTDSGPEPRPEPELEPESEPQSQPEAESGSERNGYSHLTNSHTMSESGSNPSFLDPSSAMDSSRKTKQKAEAVKIAKQQETAVHEKLKRSGLEIPKYEFLELIGKGAYGRVFKRYVLDVRNLTFQRPLQS